MTTMINAIDNRSSTLTVDNTLTVTTGNAVVTAGDIWANNIQRMDMTGFYSWAASGPYFDDTTLGTFDLLVGGTGYIKGKVVTWTAQSITGLTAGSTWYIYIDNTGTIGKTSSRTDALYIDNIVLFECWRDSTSPTNVQHTVKENHPYDYGTTVSNWVHETINTVIEDGGANISLVGTTGIGISGSDKLNDHGLLTNIADSGGSAVTWNKVYLNAGGKWAVQNTSNVFGGYWNNAGTPTALTGTRAAVYRLYASKDNLNTTTPVYFAVLDITDYAGQTAANTAIANGTPQQATGELTELELVQLGFITFRSGAITNVVVNKTTIRSGTTTGSGTNNASLVLTNTANFNGILSGADTNVQAALDTIDNWGASTTLHGVLIGEGTGSAISSTVAGTAGQILTSGGALADPVWTTATYPATVATGNILVASGTNTVGIVDAAAATTGYVLTAVNGAAPTFQATAVTGIVTLAGDSGTATGSTVTIAGGTNLTSVAGTSTVTINLDAAISGTTSHVFANAGYLGTGTTAGDTLLLRAYNTGGASYTTFATLTADAATPTMNLDTAVTINSAYIYRSSGTDVAVADGGTGLSTLTAHALYVGNTTSAPTALAVGATGEVLIGASTADPKWLAAAGADNKVLTSHNGGDPTWETASGGGITWTAITANQTAAVDNGYICNKAGLLELALPTTCAVGKTIRVTGMNTALGWKVTQAANQIIHMGTSTTTTGATGYISSTEIHDSVELVCCVANLEFIAVSMTGNITVF